MSLRPVWGNLIRPLSKGGAKGSALVTRQPSALLVYLVDILIPTKKWGSIARLWGDS